MIALVATAQDDNSQFWDFSVDPPEVITVGENGDLSSQPMEYWTEFDSAWKKWSDELWCHILEHGDPLARTLVSYKAEGAPPANPALNCPGLGGEVDYPGLRLSALSEDPDNVVLLAKIALFDCTDTKTAPRCEEELILSRFLEADRDNSFAYLNHLLLPQSGLKEDLAFSDEELAWLLEAASADQADAYWGEGFPELHETIEDALPTLPPFRPSKTMSDTAQEYGFVPDRVADFATLQVMGMQTVVGHTVGRLSEGCRAARTSGDRIALAGCRKLGEHLATHADNYLFRIDGRVIACRASQPAETNEDAVFDACRNSTVNMEMFIRFSCAAPRGLPGGELYAQMPRDHVKRHLIDLSREDEAHAFQKTALREHALFPEAFPLDPSRCGELMTLTEAQRDAVIEKQREAVLDETRAYDVDETLRFAVELLEANKPSP